MSRTGRHRLTWRERYDITLKRDENALCKQGGREMADELRPLSGVSDSRPVNRLGEFTGRRLQQGQTTGTLSSAKNARAESVASLAVEIFGPPVPPEIASDPVNMRTEWGWRRFLRQTLQNQQSALQAGDQPAALQKMTEILWKTMSPLLQEYFSNGEEVSSAGWMTPGTLMPLSALPAAHFRDANIPEKVKRFAIAQKLRVSVHSHGQPIFGGGLFYPPVIKGQDHRRAVYWQAQRHTVPGPRGKSTQHLFLSTQIDGKLLELLLIVARPALAVHIRTEDEQLRQGLDASQNFARASLAAIGWNLSQFSVGTLSETKGEF